jgi:hypothetical protein
MTNQLNHKIFIFTALDCEAKALVKFFQLKKDIKKHPFLIYKNHNFVLTVSGVGKIAMAGAVAYTLALFCKNNMPVLVNIGIAGHETHPIGNLLLTMKIVDRESGKKFYPQLIGTDWPETSELISTSTPCIKYSTDYLNDMEASAFYETAVRFSSSELIHCIKIVSDNETSSIEKIHAKLVTEWIENHLLEIEHLLKRWTKLAVSITPQELEDLEKFDDLVKKWHFTVSGKIKLKSLLRRWGVLSAVPWVSENKANVSSGSEVLQKLEADVNRLEIHL